MTSVTHFRYEIVRTFRNRVFYAVTLVIVLLLRRPRPWPRLR